MAKLLGPRSGTAGRIGKHKHRTCSSRRQSLRAATGSLEQKMCKEKIFQIQSMSNAIIRVEQKFAVKSSGVFCLTDFDLEIRLEQSEMKILQSKNPLKVARYDESYPVFWGLLRRMYGLVVKASWSESGEMGSIPAGCWNSPSHSSTFAWHWSHQWTDTHTLICCALCNFCSGFSNYVSGYPALTGF